MQKVDKKILFQVVLGVCIVSLIGACISLFSNFFYLVDLVRNINGSYAWPLIALFLSGLITGASLIFLALRLTIENRTIKGIGILINCIGFLLIFIFSLTLLNIESIKHSVYGLLLNAIIPLGVIIGLVDFQDMKEFVSIDVKNNYQETTQEVNEIQTEDSLEENVSFDSTNESESNQTEE